jgi:putative toxin-antitoxin system antitoxin component (TIGR02293 family)
MNQVEQLTEMLGGKNITGFDLKSNLDVVDAVKTGLNPRVIEHIIKIHELSRQEVEELIIPRSTLALRKKQKMRLTLGESEHVVRIARIIGRARNTFVNKDKAAHWLRRPNRALQGRIPLALLDTEEGARVVEVLLGEIAHGLFN